jgi:ketosteroid isomerase-like protein
MSQENVEIARRWNEAYNRRDLDTLIELTDPDFEMKSIFVSIESVFRGYEGFPHAYFEAVGDAYERFQVTADDYIDAGAAVLVLCRIEWRGRESGAEGTVPLAVAAWLKAGRIFYIESFADVTDGFRAVGLSEQDAHANDA